ncbi:hypothetical protein X777_12353 [Ooceraea biroi]|uniref:Translocator protein n=1 Tax=Ooceraea biroi TaxID=2015173 RepID=A0A026VZU2_OOCBI|nr:hypothetical protein X777_12353 [Ooceraea biroi]
MMWSLTSYQGLRFFSAMIWPIQPPTFGRIVAPARGQLMVILTPETNASAHNDPRGTLVENVDKRTAGMSLALYDIAALWVSTIPVGVTFYQVNPIAGYFVIPYFAWTTFAAVLNYVIYRDNKQIPDATKDVEENK